VQYNLVVQKSYKVTSNTSAVTAVLISVLCWGGAGAASKLSLRNVDAYNLIFYSNLVALLMLFVLIVISKQTKQLFGFSKKDYIFFAVQGALGMFLYRIFFNLGIGYSNAQEAFIANYMWPIFLVLFGVYANKEKISLVRMSFLMLSFMGIVIVVIGSVIDLFKVENLVGDGLAVVAAALFAFYSFRNRPSYNKLIFTFHCYMFATIFSFFTLSLSDNRAFVSDAKWGYLFLGIFVLAIANFSWTYAVEHGNRYLISNISFLTPVISLIAITVLVKEKFLITSLLGTVLVILGLFLQSLYVRKSRQTQKKV
jgi:drug/metabolite transporter (DMT)-like permease